VHAREAVPIDRFALKEKLFLPALQVGRKQIVIVVGFAARASQTAYEFALTGAYLRGQDMGFLHAARLSRAQIAALSAIGVFWGSFAAMVPDYKSAIGASDAVMGLSLMMTAVGAMLAMYLAPKLTPVMKRWLLPVAAVLVALAAAFPVAAATPVQFGVAAFGMGFAMSSLDMSANMRIAVLETRHGVHLQNLNHAMFSFSFAGAAFLTTLARKAGWEPGDVMPWHMLALFALATLTDEGRTWRKGPEHKDHPEARMPWTIVLITAGILLAAFMSENANESWSALHIERTLGARVGEGGFGPTMLGLTMGLGRMSGQFLTARFGDVRLILWGAVLGALGLVLLALAPTKAVAIAGVGAFGLGVAVMVPTANAILGRLAPAGLQGLAIARAWMIGFTGFFIGPSMIGFIAEATNLRVAFLVVAAIVATIVPLILALRRRGA
jgi:MFS family permease